MALCHGERRTLGLAFAPPQQWGRRRDRRFLVPRRGRRGSPCVQCERGRGPLDLEARRLGARLAARLALPRRSEGGPAPAAPGSVFVGSDLGVHGLLLWLRLGPRAMCCAGRPGLPPPVGLPPQRGRGSHECPAHECSPLGGQLFGRALSALPASALHATMMARGTETRSSQYCERSRRARLAGVLAGPAGRRGATAQAPSTRPNGRRDRHEVTHRELNGSSMFISRSILFVTDAMQPRAANDARGTTSTAHPPLPRCS